MMAEILANPIFTIVSENPFGVDARVIDPYMASLAQKIVISLCAEVIGPETCIR